MKCLTLGQIRLKDDRTFDQDTEWQNLMLNLSSIYAANYSVEALVLPRSVTAYLRLKQLEDEPTILFENLPVLLHMNSDIAYALATSDQPLAVALDATEVPATRTINLSEGFCSGQAH